MIGTNADGLATKKESFLNLIQNERPSCFMVQETKFKNVGQLKVKGYQLFERIRKNREGGGLLIGIENEMNCEPVLISVADEETEIIVIEIDLKVMKIRLITAYGPQEDAPEELIKKFYARLEEEIDDSENNNCEAIIELDCNAKLGKEVIKGDPKEMSENGKLLWDIVQRRNLVVGNALDKCEGVITRKRETITGIEESVIDFVIVSANMSNYIDTMEIDENRLKVLTKFSSRKGVKEVVKSDHNILTCNFTFSAPKRKQSRKEVYTLRNENNLKLFKDNTDNAHDLIDLLKTENDVNIQGNEVLKFVKNNIHKSFKKVRVNKTKKSSLKTDLDEKFDKRMKLRREIVNENKVAMKHKLEQMLDDLEYEIAAECAEKHFTMVSDNMKQVTEFDGGFNTNKMWKLKRKLINRGSEPLSSKIDLDGKLVTNPDLLKKLYLETYVDRLRNRKMSTELLNLKNLREELFRLRLERAKLDKSPPWEMSHLDKVLSKLKPNKAMDPTGLINELFRPENIGTGLKNALLMLLNNMKEKGVEPDFMSLENIVSIYKGKGQRNDLNNDRGIFILNIIRNIRDKLVYNDIYDIIESNMSNSQVGAQRDKGIRNHLFVLYSILNSVKQKEAAPIDIQIYDVKKMFDAIWLLECCNNLYESGVKNDKLSIIYESNRVHKISVKTPVGETKRVTVEDVLAQGGVISPTAAAVQVDIIGKDAEINNKNMYKYKKEADMGDGTMGVDIGPMSMIDDVANVAECGIDSVVDNAYIVAKFEQLKLQLNESKCHQMHVGKRSNFCPTLKAHNTEMDVVLEEKYLGDIVTCDGKHTKNVKSRCSKCIGVMTDIVNILKTLCLGKFFFKIGVILRQALFLSIMLLNADTWLRLSQTDLKTLESTDELLLRKLLDAPSKTPIPSLYLELGCIPVRFIIKAKRIMFLHYLLTRDNSTMISKVFWAQYRNPANGDWVLVVLEDLTSLGLDHFTLSDVEAMSKHKMKKIVKEATRRAALKYLLEKKETMSKIKPLQYSDLILQPYLTSDTINLRLKKLLFKLRTRMVPVGWNFGQKVICQVCQLPDSEDSQQHVLVNCDKTKSETIKESEYDDLFTERVERLSEIVKEFDVSLRNRAELLEEHSINGA